MRSRGQQRAEHAERAGGVAMTPEQIKAAGASRLALKRYGEPVEVARVMLFLASDESSFCTGGVYMADGGVSAGTP
jgi:NAD(P)-dependent dehydrogenase (short-subunit alcohol dehydrogenase family)